MKKTSKENNDESVRMFVSSIIPKIEGISLFNLNFINSKIENCGLHYSEFEYNMKSGYKLVITFNNDWVPTVKHVFIRKTKPNIEVNFIKEYEFLISPAHSFLLNFCIFDGLIEQHLTDWLESLSETKNNLLMDEIVGILENYKPHPFDLVL